MTTTPFNALDYLDSVEICHHYIEEQRAEIKALLAALQGIIDVARSDLNRDLLPTAICTLAKHAIKLAEGEG